MPSLTSPFVSLSVAALVGLVAFFVPWRDYLRLSTIVCGAIESEVQHQGYFSFECFGKPHQASWESWWHPQRTRDEQQRVRGQGGGSITKDWNILYHLGGNGPWVEKVDDVVEGGIAVPQGCEVEQVHMMSRHAERYPTIKAGTRMLDLLERMKSSKVVFKGDLQFVNEWKFFASNPQLHFEQLTTTGPFSGTLGSFTTGVRLRTRYLHLLSRRLSNRQKTSFWASDSRRVIDTARYFGAGFFGLNWQDTAQLHVIPETFERGADTLTPGDTCKRHIEDEEKGHDQGKKVMEAYRATYMPAIRDRLRKQNPDIDFTDDEIYAMQEMCGFETTVRGSSHWCDVFTQSEFLNFEYARDLLHYYRAGPGTPWGGVMGWLWLNATTNILLEGPTAGPFFFSFVHDGDIAPMMTALDIITDPTPLPVTHMPPKRKWRKSQVSPMGGRVIFELLSCEGKHDGRVSRNEFVRININDGITAIPGCDGGPGKSCPVADFGERVKRKGNELGDYREECGLSQDAPERITFLHQ